MNVLLLRVDFCRYIKSCWFVTGCSLAAVLSQMLDLLLLIFCWYQCEASSSVMLMWPVVVKPKEETSHKCHNNVLSRFFKPAVTKRHSFLPHWLSVHIWRVVRSCFTTCGGDFFFVSVTQFDHKWSGATSLLCRDYNLTVKFKKMIWIHEILFFSFEIIFID